MPDKCVINPDRECDVARKVEELSGDVKALDRRVDEFQKNVAETNSRFGGRIGKLEARDEVRDEQQKSIKERIDNLAKDIVEFKMENKSSITDLRKEHKESMEELRKGNKEILDAVTPMKHQIDELKELEADVKELKEKPGKTWESIKSQMLGWAVAIVLALVAAALGLSKIM